MLLALGTCFEEAYRPFEWSIDLLLRKMLPPVNMDIAVTFQPVNPSATVGTERWPVKCVR